MSRRGLGRGWRAWVEMAVERAAFMLRLRRVMSFMMDYKPSPSASSLSSPRSADALLITRSSRALQPRLVPMSKALAYFVNRDLALGWVTWRTAWRENLARSASMRIHLAHTLHCSLHRGWRGWYTTAAERSALMLTLHRGLRFIVSRRVALGLAAWRAFVLHRRALRGVGFSAMHSGLRACLSTWKTYVLVWCKAQRVVAGFAAAETRAIRRAFNTWSEMAYKALASAQRIKSAVRVLHSRPIAGLRLLSPRRPLVPPRRSSGIGATSSADGANGGIPMSPAAHRIDADPFASLSTLEMISRRRSSISSLPPKTPAQTPQRPVERV